MVDPADPTPGSPANNALNLAVARNVRRYREMRGLSQDQIASELGLHRTYWSALERGEKNLTLRTVERLADRMGVQALDLLKD